MISTLIFVTARAKVQGEGGKAVENGNIFIFADTSFSIPQWKKGYVRLLTNTVTIPLTLQCNVNNLMAALTNCKAVESQARNPETSKRKLKHE